MGQLKPAWGGVFDAIGIATDVFADVLDRQNAEAAKWREFKSSVRSDPGVRIAAATASPPTATNTKVRIEPPVAPQSPQIPVVTSRLPILQQLAATVS